MERAHAGDYLVTMQNKNYTVLLIRDRTGSRLVLEEITLPGNSNLRKSFSFRKWVEQGCPGSTCWIVYYLNLSNGTIQNAFSVTKNEWFAISQSQNFLSTLLNLHFKPIPDQERKKIGPPPPSDTLDRRAIWQPQMIVDGKAISGVSFNAWKTRWPKDGGELSGKVIEVFLPKNMDEYPSYFPYWLQISGMIGKAKIRIIDSGRKLFSPVSIPEVNSTY